MLMSQLPKRVNKQMLRSMQDLNVMMKDYMDGLSVKVFRTYNASVTLNRLLWEAASGAEVVEKQADYNRANKEVRLFALYTRVWSVHRKRRRQCLTDRLQARAQCRVCLLQCF